MSPTAVTNGRSTPGPTREQQPYETWATTPDPDRLAVDIATCAVTSHRTPDART
ncbi:hypothetical protein ACWGJT_04820 [Streptomyces xantholiticus]